MIIKRIENVLNYCYNMKNIEKKIKIKSGPRDRLVQRNSVKY